MDIVSASTGQLAELTILRLPEWPGEVRVQARTDGRDVLAVTSSRRYPSEQMGLPIMRRQRAEVILSPPQEGEVQVLPDADVVMTIFLPPARMAQIDVRRVPPRGRKPAPSASAGAS